jgi:hypothetical protein
MSGREGETTALAIFDIVCKEGGRERKESVQVSFGGTF